MIFKAKLRQIGNSLGVIIPKEVLDYIEEKWQVNVITKGDCIYLEVITDDIKYMDEPVGVITKQDKEVITKKQVITKPIKRGLIFNPKTGANEWQ